MILIRSARHVFVAILALGLFVMAANHLTDPDLWWHLRTGQLIVETRQIPHTDPYSFTRNGQPWVAHEWLSELAMYGTYRATDWSGTIILFALIILATQLLVYARCAGRPYVAGVVTLWGALAAAPAWGARPQMLSLLLGALFLFLLERRHGPLLWWMVLLTLIWVNLHAGYVLGIALLVLSLFGELLDIAFGHVLFRHAAPRLRRLGLVLFACLLVVPLNPNGARLYLYPFQTLASPAMQQDILEWASPNFHQSEYLPLLLLFLAVLAALALSSRRLRPGQILILLITAAAALHSERHVPIFCLVAPPLLSELSEGWAGKLFSPTVPGSGFPRPAPGKLAFNAFLLAGFTILCLLRVTSVIRSQAQTEARSYPQAATAFLAAHPDAGPVLNAYDWGGYLIWKLYPQLRVFIDGRADVYGDAFLEDYRKAYDAEDDWQTVLKRWKIKSVVIPPTSPLAAALRPDQGWTPVYRDNQAIILELQTPSASSGP